MTFRCISCGENKQQNEFYPTKLSKRGHHGRCKKCWAEYDKNWRLRNREVSRLYRANYYKTHRAKISKLNWRSSLKTRYGITPEAYEAMVVQQGGKCSIRGSPPRENRRLCVDHSHKNGVVRALLCDKCNAGLGAFRDDPGLLIKAAEFVRAFMEVTNQR